MAGPDSELRFRNTFVAALGLSWISGAAGLAHQLIWTRRLVDLLGANADTFSKVIGAFFIGLALGAWLASRPTVGRDWNRVMLAELTVALLAIPVMYSFELADGFFPGRTPGAIWKLTLPLLLITPPAVAMGLVMPWMLRALSCHRHFAPHHGVWLYSVNTLGGLLGIGAVLFFALPRWGVTGAGWGTISLNLAVAAMAFVLAVRPRGRSALTSFHNDHEAESSAQETRSRLPARALAFASGFLVLGSEVILQHQLSQVTIHSLFSSATVLSMVLIALAGAAAFVPLLVRWVGGTSAAIQSALIMSAILCAAQPFLFTRLQNGLELLPYELRPLPYTMEVLRIGFVAVCPMLLAAGFVFPLLLRDAMTQRGGSREVGLLLAWNGLGGWLGAEASQGWVLPALGLWVGMAAVAAVYLGLFCFIRVRSAKWMPVRPGSRIAMAFAFAAVLVALVRAGHLPQVNLAKGERLAALRVGREGVVAVVEHGAGDWRMLFNNSYTLGGSKAQFNQERQAHLPILLHGAARSVATLGVATGGTLAGVALHPGIERIEAVELSPLVLRFADEYFGPFNREIFRDRRVKFIQDDARRAVAARTAEYDVVVGDLFLPWRTGEGRLFALEHFQNVRRSLKPRGLFCQWLPLFQLTRLQYEMIVRTFHEVFPEAFVLRGDFYADLPILGLVGGRELSAIDWTAVEVGCERLRAEGKTLDPLVCHAAGVAMMSLGPLPAPESGPINTLANARLEWDAGVNILGLQSPWFIGVPCAEHVRALHRAGQPLVPVEMRDAHDAGQFFLTLEIAARLELPALENLKSQMNARLPESMRNDPAADWSQWPMRIKPVSATSR